MTVNGPVGCAGRIMPEAVRPATAADSASLLEIDELVSDSPWRAGQFDSACASDAAGAGECALVLAVQGRVRGFVVFSRVLDEASIDKLAVHPAQQGRGLGRSLLQAALGRMRQHDVRRCLLEVRASNAAARGLYQHCHFRLDGVRKNYYPTPQGREDALLMSRQL